jgi:hypothetical protein
MLTKNKKYMEFYGKEFGEVLFITFQVTIVVGMASAFRVKYLLKRYYIKQHNQLFHNYDITESIKLTYFFLTMKKWKFVQENKTLAWLKFNRIIYLIAFSFIPIHGRC